MAMDMQVAMRIAASVSGGSSVDDLRRSVEKLNGSANGISNAFSKAGMLVKGFIGIEAVRRAADYGLNIIKMADSLDELSERTGVSAMTLSSLSKSAQQSGVSLEAVATGMKKLSVNLVEAQQGSKEAARGFAALRLDPKSFKSSEEAMYAIADRFKDMEDGANKVAIAQALFGKAGEASIPWLNQGAEAMRKYGSTFTQEMINMSAKFSDLLDEMGFNSKKFAASAIESMLPALSEIIKSFNGLNSSGKDLQILWDLLAEGLRVVAAAAQYLIAGFKGLLEVLNTTIDVGKMVGTDGFFGNAGERIKDGFDKIARLGMEGDNKVREVMRNSLIFGEGTADEARARGIKEAGGKDKKDDKKGGFNPNMASFNTKGDPEGEKIKKFELDQKNAIKKMENEMDAVNMTALAYQQLVAQTELKNKSDQLAISLSPEKKKELEDVTAVLQQQTKDMIELKYQTERTFNYGAKESIKGYADMISNMGKQTSEVFTKAFKGMEDALTNFVMTGKLDFKSLADSIIADMVRIAIRQAIMKPLMSGLGSAFGVALPFANGGVMTGDGAMPLQKYAAGGIASTPQFAMFGEGSMPEAFVPLPDGRNIPVKMSGGAGGNNNVTVNVSVDGGGSKVTSSGKDAAVLGEAISKAVQSELLKQKRPGGLLYG